MKKTRSAPKRKPAPRKKKTKYKTRIVGLEYIPADQLIPNDKNWRTHDSAQLGALRGSLGQLGLIAAGIAYPDEKGRLILIDGHARAAELGSDPMPVLIVNLTAEEAALALATVDPIGAMAGMDLAKLEELLKEVQADDEGLSALLADLADQARAGEAEPGNVPAEIFPDPKVYQLVIEFETDDARAAALESLTEQGYKARTLTT